MEFETFYHRKVMAIGNSISSLQKAFPTQKGCGEPIEHQKYRLLFQSFYQASPVFLLHVHTFCVVGLLCQVVNFQKSAFISTHLL